jgi:hypothetical protein
LKTLDVTGSSKLLTMTVVPQTLEIMPALPILNNQVGKYRSLISTILYIPAWQTLKMKHQKMPG